MIPSVPRISLRPIRDEDLPFLLSVYASSRQEELDQVVWGPGQREAFLAQQFGAQHAWWQEHYAGATFDLIEVDSVPAGRFYVHRGSNDIRVVDIALLPGYRGSGVGSRLLEGVFEEADGAGKRVSVHVEKFNPARRLYQRLGFQEAEDKGVYLLMVRPAS